MKLLSEMKGSFFFLMRLGICPLEMVNTEEDLPGGSVVKNPPAKAGDPVLIPGSGRSTAEGNGNPFWYSCLKNSMDRGAWQTTVHGIAKSQTQLSTHTHTHARAHTHIFHLNA